jgi:hypothetical protein
VGFDYFVGGGHGVVVCCWLIDGLFRLDWLVVTMMCSPYRLVLMILGIDQWYEVKIDSFDMFF